MWSYRTGKNRWRRLKQWPLVPAATPLYLKAGLESAIGDVYCYFDNDIKVRAPFDANKLIELVGWTACRPRGDT